MLNSINNTNYSPNFGIRITSQRKYSVRPSGIDKFIKECREYGLNPLATTIAGLAKVKRLVAAFKFHKRST